MKARLFMQFFTLQPGCRLCRNSAFICFDLWGQSIRKWPGSRDQSTVWVRTGVLLQEGNAPPPRQAGATGLALAARLPSFLRPPCFVLSLSGEARTGTSTQPRGFVVSALLLFPPSKLAVRQSNTNTTVRAAGSAGRDVSPPKAGKLDLPLLSTAVQLSNQTQIKAQSKQKAWRRSSCPPAGFRGPRGGGFSPVCVRWCAFRWELFV